MLALTMDFLIKSPNEENLIGVIILNVPNAPLNKLLKIRMPKIKINCN